MQRKREREREGRINCFSAKAIGGGNEASCSVDMDREGGRKEEGAMIVHNGSTTAEGDSPPPAVRPSGPTQQAIRTRGRERGGGGVGFASTQHTYRIPAPRAVCSVRRCLLLLRPSFPPLLPPRRTPHMRHASQVRMQRGVWAYSGRCGAQIRRNTRTNERNVHVEYSAQLSLCDRSETSHSC